MRCSNPGTSEKEKTGWDRVGILRVRGYKSKFIVIN